MLHGYGQLIDTDGNIYIGEWEENKKHGYGKEIILSKTFIKTNR